MAPTDNVQLDTEGTLYILSIATVTLEDAGSYECVARNKAGDDTCSAVLTVDGRSWSKFLLRESPMAQGVVRRKASNSRLREPGLNPVLRC